MKKLIFMFVALLMVGLTANAQDASVKKCPFSGNTIPSTAVANEENTAKKACPHAEKVADTQELKVLKANLPATATAKTACQKKCAANKMAGNKSACPYSKKQANSTDKLVKVAEDVPFINAVVKEEN